MDNIRYGSRELADVTLYSIINNNSVKLDSLQNVYLYEKNQNYYLDLTNALLDLEFLKLINENATPSEEEQLRRSFINSNGEDLSKDVMNDDHYHVRMTSVMGNMYKIVMQTTLRDENGVDKEATYIIPHAELIKYPDFPHPFSHKLRIYEWGNPANFVYGFRLSPDANGDFFSLFIQK